MRAVLAANCTATGQDGRCATAIHFFSSRAYSTKKRKKRKKETDQRKKRSDAGAKQRRKRRRRGRRGILALLFSRLQLVPVMGSRSSSHKGSFSDDDD